jgi:hypothetical protein
VKRGARGFSSLPGLTKASRRHFLLQPICVGRKEVLTIVGHFTFLVSTTTTTVEDHQRAVTRRIIIKINPLDETICTALRLRDKRKFIILPCSGGTRSHFSNNRWSWLSEFRDYINEWSMLCSYISYMPLPV